MTIPERPDNWPALCVTFTEAVLRYEAASRERQDAQETYASALFNPEAQREFLAAIHREVETERKVNMILRVIMSGASFEVAG